jgi:hypothetical protein
MLEKSFHLKLQVMLKNNWDFELAKADWVLECADEFQEHFKWEGINLRPAFIRFVWTLLGSQSVTRDWFENKLISKASFQDIISDLKEFQKSWKSKLREVPGLQYTKHKIQWLGYHSKKITKKKPLIVVQHWKFVNYLKESKLFDELDPLWLAENPRMAKEMGLDADDLIVQQVKLFRTSKSHFPINIMHNIANELKTSLIHLRPSAIFVVEGDTPRDALIAEIGRMLDIPVYCFQWGLFDDKVRTAFSEMQFTKFLSWGPIFEDQLKPFNPQQDFISFGPLSSNNINRTGNKIIFLSQPVALYITKEDKDMFTKLAISLAKKFPNKVFWRPHPMELNNSKQLLDLEKSKVNLFDPRKSLSSQLQSSLVAVSITSSSLLDALHSGVIPISFNTTSMKKYPFPIVEQGVGFEFRSLDHALRQITDLMNNQDKISGIQKQIADTHATFFTNTEFSQQKNYIRMICKNKLK